MSKIILLVGLGGAFGSIFRFLISAYSIRLFPFHFLIGTFVVNIIGCFLIGLLTGLAKRYTIFDRDLKFLLATGFCGGFTTFSTFSLENVRLFNNGQFWTLGMYISASIIFGFIAVWLGFICSKIIAQ